MTATVVYDHLISEDSAQLWRHLRHNLENTGTNVGRSQGTGVLAFALA